MRKLAQTSFLFVSMMCITSCTAIPSPTETPSTYESNTLNSVKQESSLSTEFQTPNVNNSIDEEGDSKQIQIVKELLKYAFSENGEITSLLNSKAHKNECNISLMNIFEDEAPEITLGFLTTDNVELEYLYAMDENDVPICMGSFTPSTGSSGLFTDSTNAYYIIDCGCHPSKDNLNWVNIKKLELPIADKAVPDLADYQNKDALEFIYDTHMYFLRYDNEDWDSEKQSWKAPNETAAMFYCEDSGLYEAYSVSKWVLELTSIEINDYINSDGNHIYSYLPGENYLVSRREYEQIKSKIFEILTEVTDEPDISSGWINIDDVDNWLDSLA